MHEYREDEVQESLFLLLPEEMFLHICSFLDVTDIVINLSRVCKKFYSILQSESIWKSWIAARWNRQYPVLENNTRTIDWKKACYSLESECKQWVKELNRTVAVDGHLSDVDAVLFINSGSKCLTGSRDRRIMIWDVSDSSAPKNIGRKDAHEGWVWRLKEFNNNLYSASWDYTIKLWDMNVDLIARQQYNCDTAVLSIQVDPSGIIYGGTFTGIYAFDPRLGSEPIFTLISRKTPVLTLDLLHGDLISGVENQSLSVWDLRTRLPKQTVKLDRKNYPMSSQVFDDLLYIGDRSGSIRLYSSDDGTVAERSVIDIGFRKPISALNVNHGSITASCDTLVKVSLPLRPLLPVAIFETGHVVCSMNSLNGRLAIGTASTIEFYLPESLEK